jgi:hypothetical protein
MPMAVHSIRLNINTVGVMQARLGGLSRSGDNVVVVA